MAKLYEVTGKLGITVSGPEVPFQFALFHQDISSTATSPVYWLVPEKSSFYFTIPISAVVEASSEEEAIMKVEDRLMTEEEWSLTCSSAEVPFEIFLDSNNIEAIEIQYIFADEI